jgi:DNA-binding transcriptional LysR family regulator
MRLDYAIYGQANYLHETPPISAGGRRHTLMMLTGVDSEPAHVQWLGNQFSHASTELLTENPEALLQWCRNGMGLALLPVRVANKYRELLSVSLSSAPPAVSVWASYHADSRDSPHLLALLDTVRHLLPSQQ